MAGIYVHIPFCKSRCAYCDFYSTTREAEKEAYVQALCCEIAGRREELRGSHVRTIYIGGGTPSVLAPAQLRSILDCIHENYEVESDAEVTVEMNPEDVVIDELGLINRVSLGVQTFDDGLLRLIRRRHNAARAVEAVRRLQETGFGNISIDLIYGLPGQTLEMWEHDVDVAFGLGIQHLSAYALSYEEGTPLSRWRSEGRVQEVSDELSVAMYALLRRRALEAGFEHYEISNFALPGYHSRHNSSYWTGEAYLGFGPGAHSFDGTRTRHANLPDLTAYLKSSCLAAEATEEKRFPAFTEEVLSEAELYDEAVMCGLRTRWGVEVESIGARFGTARQEYLLRMATPHLRARRLVLRKGRLLIASSALMISDTVMSDLMSAEP